MKLKFKKQDFQTNAVTSITSLFKGQETGYTIFSVIEESQMSLLDNGTGTGNRLIINEETLVSNMNNVQKENALPQTQTLENNNFCIEMETGTGKTFVYTKTIFELNKLYGFTKFIIVVPSVAIREGVYKSLQMTEEYFKGAYDNVTYKFYIYNSAKLSTVRDFATDTNIQIMIINIDAFRKSENIINQEQDRLNGEKAIDFIRQTNPIIIIDEPQSVDTTDKAKEAISSLNPLVTLRYSATHKDKMNLLYRLTPVDAYEMGIVKQICVSSNQAYDDFNKPYIRLVDVSMKKSFFAKIEIDIKSSKTGIVERKIKTVKKDDNLYFVSGERAIYQGYVITGIDCTPELEKIEFSNQEYLSLGKAMGDIPENTIKKAQIRRTIETHLDKELRYIDRGIKVLSLFFIDEVAKYRDYENEDTRGIYAKIFEESYNQLINQDQYKKIKEKFPFQTSDVHNGYFSQDKKGNYKNTKGDTIDDFNTYNTIMKDKEWLLSFDCPLRFIFSHSTLKEGWDNPNVFQVCTLVENKSVFTCRQKVGRGLRLCVDSDGNRIEDKSTNILHIIANESYAEFAENLQGEIEKETGYRFGVLEIGLFTDLTYTNQEGETNQITYEDANELIEHLVKKNYITKDGKIKDTLKNDIANGTVDLPTRFETARERLVAVVKNASKTVPIQNSETQVRVKLKKEVFADPKFLDLWDKIKHKTMYKVQINEEELTEICLNKYKTLPPIHGAKVVTTTAKINIKTSKITGEEMSVSSGETITSNHQLPDIIRIIEEATGLTRKLIADIIIKSGRLMDFKNNPQKFIEESINIIGNASKQLSIDGIRYTKLDGEEYYEGEIFDQEELIAYLNKNAVPVDHSLYDHVIYDSETVEKTFAHKLDNDQDVKMFLKLPDKFKIDTPIGTYNPDWAVYIESNGVDKLYFVIETKGSTNVVDLRHKEEMKIHCGREHFKAIDDVEFRLAKEWVRVKLSI